MRFGVLGPQTAWTDDGRPVPIPELKVRTVLAVLLVHDGHPVSSGRLIEDLWGRDAPANALGALRAKMSQLRRALGEAEPGGRALVESGPAGYRLRAVSVDARRFQALALRAGRMADAAERVALLSDALALWRGPAYADFADEPFARGAAGRLEERRRTALEDLNEARLELGEHGAAIGELTDLVERHPLRERLRAVLMKALYRSGRQHEALAVYRDLRARLGDELGLDPGPEITALHQSILEQDPALLGPAARATAFRSNLPVPLTGLVGRTGAVGAVRELLGGQARLVTLTGPGGVGKTRLALEAAAAQVGEDFADGVVLVELAALAHGTASPDAVAEVVISALGVRGDGPEPPADRLVNALAGRRALLVLDNCEHVVEPVAKLADLLLRSDTGTRVLATGQEPLGIAGEHVHVLPPLDEPDAVELFAARASAAAPGFALDRGNAEAVATICRRLDGVPLALELAAARVRAFGVHRLAELLDDRFRVLASGRRAAPVRQRTLRAMMDWSWEPLTEPERAVLRRLAVHAGGCTLDAAEETCAGDGVAARDIADLLARLVDRSLVVRTEGPAGSRYRLLESVAAYCLERLNEAGETGEVQSRHDLYYTLLAECAEAHRRGAARMRWLARLDFERANLRGALDGIRRRGDAALAVRMAGALAWYWILRGETGQAGRALGESLAESVRELRSGRPAAAAGGGSGENGAGEGAAPLDAAALRVVDAARAALGDETCSSGATGVT